MMFGIAFAVILILFVLMSFVLEYHWRKHTSNSKMLFVARFFYYGGSLLFLFLLFVMLLVDPTGFEPL